MDRVFDTNLIGTFNLLKKCVKDKSKIIFLSSSRVYSIALLNKTKGNLKKYTKIKSLKKNEMSTDGPKSIYGFTKFASEELIKEYAYLFNIRYIINRLGVISGPWQFGKQDQGFVSLWVWKHLNKKKLSYIGFGGKGSQIRDVVHIEDVCKLITMQVKRINHKNNSTYNVGGGKKNTISLKDLTKICQKITSNKIEIFSKKTTSEYDIPYYVTDNSKIKKIYGWSPKKKILDIVRDIYKWMLLNKKILKKYIK